MADNSTFIRSPFVKIYEGLWIKAFKIQTLSSNGPASILAHLYSKSYFSYLYKLVYNDYLILIIVLNSIEWNIIFKHHVIGIRLHDAYFVDEGGERKNRKGKYLWIRKVKLQLFQITTSSYAYLKCTKKKCIIVCVRTNLRLIKMQKLHFFSRKSLEYISLQ